MVFAPPNKEETREDADNDSGWHDSADDGGETEDESHDVAEFVVAHDVGAAFPPPPRDLSTITLWGSELSTSQIVDGLSHLHVEVRSDWSVWMNGIKLGRINAHGGKYLRGICACATHVNCSCRISLAMRKQTNAELRQREASIVCWLIQGTETNSAHHIAAGTVLQKATRALPS